jgi:hypothetical protein
VSASPLTEALELVARRRAFTVTEVKPEAGAAGDRTARLLAALLYARRAHRPGADRVSTTSFDLLTAASLAGCGSVSGALIAAPHVEPDVAARRASGRGLTDVHLNPVHVRRDRNVVHRVRRLGLLVAVGVVDDPDEAKLMARLGADMICTDDPIGLAHHRSSRSSAACSRAERTTGDWRSICSGSEPGGMRGSRSSRAARRRERPALSSSSGSASRGCHSQSMCKEGFALDALLLMEPGADDRAPGGAITVALCGSWEHEPPCPLAPHHTRAERAGDEVRLRVLFAAEPDEESRVRAMIGDALAEGSGVNPEGGTTSWRLVGTWTSQVRPEEEEHAGRLARS